MRRISIWFTGTLVIVIMLFLYRTSTGGGQSTQTVVSRAQAPGVVGASPPATPSQPGPTRTAARKGGAGAPTRSGGTITVNGSLAQTRWGPVQVQIKISSGRVVDVTAVVSPDGNSHDLEINSVALPELRKQVLAAQSANIDGVSGATVTSDGYRESLQAALDAAHMGG